MCCFFAIPLSGKKHTVVTRKVRKNGYFFEITTIFLCYFFCGCTLSPPDFHENDTSLFQASATCGSRPLRWSSPSSPLTSAPAGSNAATSRSSPSYSPALT